MKGDVSFPMEAGIQFPCAAEIPFSRLRFALEPVSPTARRGKLLYAAKMFPLLKLRADKGRPEVSLRRGSEAIGWL